MTTNPWDLKAWPAEGDKYEHIIHQAVGRFLSMWENEVESNFAHLFGIVCHGGYYPETTLIADRAFGRIITPRGRLDVIEEAVKVLMLHLGDKMENQPEVASDVEALKRDVDPIIKGYRNYGTRRNEIAHGTVHFYPMLFEMLGKEVLEIEPREGYVLGPPSYNVPKVSVYGKPTYLLNSSQIDELYEDVQIFAQAIPDWYNRLAQLADKLEI